MEENEIVPILASSTTSPFESLSLTFISAKLLTAHRRFMDPHLENSLHILFKFKKENEISLEKIYKGRKFLLEGSKIGRMVLDPLHILRADSPIDLHFFFYISDATF